MIKRLTKLASVFMVALLLAASVVAIIPPQEAQAAVFTVRTAASTDDVWVNYDNVAVAWEYQDATVLTGAGYYSNTLDKTGTGMRFQAVTVPQGSLITAATITFKAKTSYALTTVNTRFTGEDVDDAATFSGIADYQARRGTVVGGANDDYITTAQVAWDNIGAWVIDTEYTSPSLVTIVQEIVDREGWASGNDMVIWWDDHEGRSDAVNFTFRDNWSWDGLPANAPQISITYGVTSDLADVISLEATNITATTADLNGVILDLHGAGNVTTRGFQWGTTWGTYPNDVSEAGAFGTGVYTLNAAGLPAGSRIYYRAYATNVNGTMYGIPLLYYNSVKTGVPYTINLAITQEADFTEYAAHQFNPVLEKEAGETNIKDPSVIVIGDAIYMYYTSTTAGVSSVLYATSSDGGINFTKQGTSLSPTGAGWESGQVGYVSVYDTEVVGDNRYAMIYSGSNGTIWAGLGYAYSADGITWIRGDSNPVVPLGLAGEWDDYMIVATSNIVLVGNTYYMHYGGKANADLYWDEGLVTWTDFEGTYTKNPGNPIVPRQTSAIQTLTAQTNIATTTVTVGDTSVFAVNMPVWVRDNVAGVNDEWNRVASITDATHLELLNAADRNYPIGSTIRSVAYGGLASMMSLFYSPVTTNWVLLTTAHLPYGEGTIRETSAYLTSEDGLSWTWQYDPDYSPPVPFDWDSGWISAENPRILFDAQVSQFTTLTASEPAVITNNATGVGKTGATLQGTLTTLGGETTVYNSFEYGLTQSYGIETPEQTKTAVGGFNQAISGLEVNTLYHYRAVVRWDVVNYAYGLDFTFITSAEDVGGELFVSGGAVFDDYITAGDMIFFADFTNEYAPYYPTEDSANYFDLLLIDTDGVSVIAAAPLIDWGRRPQAIYLSPDSAVPITKGEQYYLKVRASFNPAIVASYRLQSADWYGSDLSYLDKWCIRLAHIMELHYELTFVSYVMGKGEVLNDMGGVEFDKGIAGLSYVRPDLFQTTVHIPTYTLPTYTDAFEGQTDWETQVGASVATTMGTLGDLVSIDGKGVIQLILVVVMIAVVLLTKSFFFGLIVAMPIVLYGNWLRVMPIALTAVLVSIMAFLLVYKIWGSKS